MSPKKANRLIVIGGPTASGKTTLALSLAEHFKTDIISADSRQCYKEMNIGTAKPSTDELEMARHHFINSHSIHDEVTAGTFMRYALDKLTDLFKEHQTVICVGGTGLYIKALCTGLDIMPSIDTKIKEDIKSQFENEGLIWLQNEVKKEDSCYFESIDTNNPMRLMRGLTFKRSTGKSILEYQGSAKRQRPFDIEYHAIEMERSTLYDRINKRADLMMSDGLLNEVISLKSKQSLKALQTVGYKELFAFLNGDYTLEQAVDKIKQHSRNYAKRQQTWFKNQGDFHFGNAKAIEEKLKSTNCR